MTKNENRALRQMMENQAAILHALSHLLLRSPHSSARQAELAMDLKKYQGRTVETLRGLIEDKPA